MDNKALEQMIREVVSNITQSSVGTTAHSAPATSSSNAPNGKLTYRDYPLSEHRRDLIKTPTGKYLDEITLEGVMNGSITADDVKIAPETLTMQAEVAESVGRYAFAKNLRRAAELINVPDERILEIYNALRPYRSTKQELLAIADELEQQYHCQLNSKLVRESAELYEKRGRLKA